jgi:hypothetical protein
MSVHYIIQKTLIINKYTKRVLSSIVTHSYMFRSCWVIFRENFRYHYTRVALYSWVRMCCWMCTALFLEARTLRGPAPVDSHYTARHDTKKTSVHSHLPSVNRQAKYSLLSNPTTLSSPLSVRDGLVWIWACQNHKRIFCPVVSCRVVSCRRMWIDSQDVKLAILSLLQTRKRTYVLRKVIYN